MVVGLSRVRQPGFEFLNNSCLGGTLLSELGVEGLAFLEGFCQEVGFLLAKLHVFHHFGHRFFPGNCLVVQLFNLPLALRLHLCYPSHELLVFCLNPHQLTAPCLQCTLQLLNCQLLLLILPC
jgi:hypothetical protein